MWGEHFAPQTITDMTSDKDIAFMQTCLDLAARAAGRTSPNPMVGAVVLSSEGELVGQGFHHRAGEAHAEVLALEEAGERARGGTLYANLEPCCHTGRTPPCVERVIASGVTRVVAGMRDPNPLVAGGGAKRVSEDGIEIQVGVLEDECRWLNRGFIKRHTQGLPWLCLKLATTLDGKIADREGTSRWITGPESKQRVHELRNAFDCVLIGFATAAKDDPLLNVRDISGGRDPLRAVVDPRLSVSPTSRLCIEGTGGDTVLFCSQEAKAASHAAFPEHVRLIDVGHEPGSHYLELKQALAWLAEQGVLTVLCEGGGRLAGRLLEQGLVDEICWFIAPKIIGDPAAVPAVATANPVVLKNCWQLEIRALERLGTDILVHGVPSSRVDAVVSPTPSSIR